MLEEITTPQAGWRRYNAIRAEADGMYRVLCSVVLLWHPSLDDAARCLGECAGGKVCREALEELVSYEETIERERLSPIEEER